MAKKGELAKITAKITKGRDSTSKIKEKMTVLKQKQAQNERDLKKTSESINGFNKQIETSQRNVQQFGQEIESVRNNVKKFSDTVHQKENEKMNKENENKKLKFYNLKKQLGN